LNRSLRLLSVLGVLTFPAEERGEVVMRVNFLQEAASSDEIKIDLTSLRQVERCEERKLALMQEYALSPAERRGQLLRSYFLGEQPLIEPFVPRQDLTDEQRAIVRLSEGYHLIQGPAGSGKTTLLQEHFRYLVEYHLVPAERILVTAHFHSAVDRVGNQLDYLQSGGRPIPTKTLQSISTGIFRQHVQLLKQVSGQPYFPEGKAIQLLTGTWQEVDERELALVSQALDRLYRANGMLEYLPAHMEPLRLLGIYRPNASTERDCLKAISLFRTLGIYPASISDNEELLTTLKGIGNRNAWLLRKLAFYYATFIAYQFVQGEQGVYTYDDQVLFALVILRANPDIAKRWQGKYEHIIIDEFQDFTPAEAEMIGILSHTHRNVMAVGDMRQRILDNPKEQVPLSATFELVGNDMPVQEHRLTTNFRSVQDILDFACAVLSSFQWEHQQSALGSKGIKPTVIRIDPNTLFASEHERSTGSLIVAMVDAALYHMGSLPPEVAGSVAFLVARSDLSYPVQQCLKRRGCLFAVLESQHRYQSYHARRVLTYFRLIQDSNQTNEMERLLRHCVSPYFSTSQIARLNEIARRLGMKLLDAALEPGVCEQIGATEEHLAVLQQHVAIIRKHSPDSTCKAVWQSIQAMRDELANQSDAREQTDEYIQEKNEIEEELSKLEEKSVQEALEHIDSYITFIEENQAHRKLVVATLNNAKSQDFDTVFLLGADALKARHRWYVSVTRARQRFYCLVDASKDNEVLASVPKGLFEEVSWPE
ncbi:MAG TPA: ATP-dependent helicase, partial [Ktedonobacteraceae bacterium]|nr:ATP-dependent helicase [Ktedonobacteraceae bacterium]